MACTKAIQAILGVARMLLQGHGRGCIASASSPERLIFCFFFQGLASASEPWPIICGSGSSIFAHSQVQSGGLLQATPHCVRAASGPSAAGIARNAFAVFMQPRCMPLTGLFQVLHRP